MSTGQNLIDNINSSVQTEFPEPGHATTEVVNEAWTEMAQSANRGPILSYAEIIRLKMKTADNPTGERLSIREAARRTGYSYEHVRKAYKGDTTYISAEFNSALCKLLGLDEDQMWRVVVKEKLAHRFGSTESVVSKGHRFDEIWAQLETPERDRLTDIAEGLLLARRAIAARETIGLASVPMRKGRKGR